MQLDNVISFSEKRIRQRASYSLQKNSPRIVKATLKSVYGGLLLFARIHSTICVRMQTGNELMLSTRSTGFRTNKRYAILLEFLGDLCLKVGFCLSVIPFSSAINVISTRN